MTLDKTTLGVILTLGVLIFGAGRYIGTLESRIAALESKDKYEHGDYQIAGAK